MPYVFVQGSSIIEEINQSISPYQRVSSLLRGKEKINTRIAPLHAELDRCPVRLVEVEDEHSCHDPRLIVIGTYGRLRLRPMDIGYWAEE